MLHFKDPQVTRDSSNPHNFLMKSLIELSRIINWHTGLVVLLAAISTWLCARFGWLADLPANLIAVAIIFPIVFSINAAYRRREDALSNFASLKASALAILFAHRDWVPGGRGEEARRFRMLNAALFRDIHSYFSTAKPDRELGNSIITTFSDISRSVESLRAAGVPANEISRVNQYLRGMMFDYEKLRNILHYRTPVSLRSYSTVFLNAFPILYGPYFAFLGDKYHTLTGYFVAVIYSVVLVSLDHIQDDLENPFDGQGVDDVDLSLPEDYHVLREDGAKTQERQ
jgi:predicted membrane chloride channel (bestrophin family)